jgi:hypothetical protein
MPLHRRRALSLDPDPIKSELSRKSKSHRPIKGDDQAFGLSCANRKPDGRRLGSKVTLIHMDENGGVPGGSFESRQKEDPENKWTRREGQYG